MIYLIICAVVWLIGIPVAYNTVIKKWEKHSKAEKIYFSCVWPLLLPLYLINCINDI